MSEDNGMPPALNLLEYDVESHKLPLTVAGGVLCIVLGWKLIWWASGMSALPELSLFFEYFPMIVLTLFFFLAVAADHPGAPRSFRRFMEDSYGLTFTNLPERKPGNGSHLPVRWWKHGESEEGWLTVRNNKAIIETTDGRYLKPLDKEEDK